MSCLGVHFALTKEDVAVLRSLSDENERLAHIQNDIEPRYFETHPEFKAESDKAWDAMHRALSDGQLTWEDGKYPLNHTILAGERLYTQADYIVSLKTPQQVRDIAAALSKLTEQDFRQRYFAIDQDSYDDELSDGDFQYTWDWFKEVRDLYARAAQMGRYVIFTADQ